jgi:hypothetical protein
LLVEALRDKNARRNGGDAPSLLWSGADAVLFSALVDALAAAEIPFHQSVVHDSAAGTFARFPLSFGTGAGYEIRIAEADWDTANDIVNSVLATAEETAPAESGTEPPEAGAARTREKWRPGDAVVEIWAGNDGEWAGYLCDALRESHIRARVAVEPGVAQRILVRPVDEEAARRVLKEIENPPKAK